jgi:hypothetical protein
MDTASQEKSKTRQRLLERLETMKRAQLLLYAHAFHIPAISNAVYNNNSMLRTKIIDAWSYLYDELESDWPHFVQVPYLMFKFNDQMVEEKSVRVIRKWCQDRSVPGMKKYHRDDLIKAIKDLYKGRQRYTTMFPDDIVDDLHSNAVGDLHSNAVQQEVNMHPLTPKIDEKPKAETETLKL